MGLWSPTYNLQCENMYCPWETADRAMYMEVRRNAKSWDEDLIVSITMKEISQRVGRLTKNWEFIFVLFSYLGIRKRKDSKKEPVKKQKQKQREPW